MTKKFLFLVVALLMGSTTAIKAKINYVPLYIVDTTADVKGPKHAPVAPLIITQDGHKLILPELEDSVMLMLFKDDQCVYVEDCYHKSTVYLPTTLVGDFEMRLVADTYYYYGYITLEIVDMPGIPCETDRWKNITLLGSSTPFETILNNLMGLNVVEYTNKEDTNDNRHIGLLANELRLLFPQIVQELQDGSFRISYPSLVPILVCCIQELKYQLDSRTETIVDIMMSRGYSTSDVSAVRSAIGNSLLSVAPTPVNEPAQVRYVLTDNVSNAYITVTDMGGRVITKAPVSPSDTSVSIDSGLLNEGIFLCTLFANGENIGTKRLVKTK